MGIKGLAMEEYAVLSPALKGCPCCDSNSFAGVVANSHHDLKPK